MRALYALGACLPLVACASTDGIEQELSRMRRDLRGVQGELAQTRQQVERLEGRVTLLSLGKGAVQPAPRTAMATPTRPRSRASTNPKPRAQKVLPVVRLGANASAAAQPTPSDRDWVDTGALDQGQPPVLIKLGPSGKVPDKLPVDHSVLLKKDPVLHVDAKASPRKQYKAALDKLRKDKEPQTALRLFKAFGEQHPKSRLADNAMYWRGECLYVLARYEDAITTMNEVVERFPRSAKTPDALLRTGESWLALGDKDKGLKSLRRVIDRHPTSEAARRARARLDIEGGQ